MDLYPVDMSSFMGKLCFTFDDVGIPYSVNLSGYHPALIAQYALAHWNQYCLTGTDYDVFLKQAEWLLEHETRISGAGGWPISFSHPDIYTSGSWLSATAQGCGISVLTRAYQLTRDNVWMKAAQRVVRTFERDILDGGVSAPIGSDGIFFEEVAVYPAAHLLDGFIFGLFGLFDYMMVEKDASFNDLIGRGLSTLHRLLNEFDTGFWTRANLLQRDLASPDQLARQIILLTALATHTNCTVCSRYVLRWQMYQQSLLSRLRYLTNRCCTFVVSAVQRQVSSTLFYRTRVSPLQRVCVPITAFPVTGGMRTVLTGIAQITLDIWQMEYLTPYVGPDADSYVIHRFGTSGVGPWQFPVLWLYFFAGCWNLLKLLYHKETYDVILPQDGIVTAAFAALVAKLAGIRTVCIDHGDLGLLKSRIYRDECRRCLATKHWLWRILTRFQYMLYWPSRLLLARLAAFLVDHLLIPGVAGDGVEEICHQLGVQPSRITRFANMIDMQHHIIPDAETRARTREKFAIAADATVITMICRLAPEKGIDFAIEAVNQVLSALSPKDRMRIRVIIAGDGPQRTALEEDICKRGLSQTFVFTGEASRSDVVSILGISDIFLYTSRRGAGYPLSILEAMASGCAVVASPEPLANVYMLSEGRGVIIPPGDVKQTGDVLSQLVNDPPLYRRMGTLAREYVATHHSAEMLRRALLRVTFWSSLDGLLSSDTDVFASNKREHVDHDNTI